MAWNYDYRYPFAPQQNLYGFQCSARSYNFVPTTESVSQRGTVDSESVTTGTGTMPVEGAGTTAKRTDAFKIINPRKKSEYVTKKFRADGAFKTPEELQDNMYETFSDFLPEGRDFELYMTSMYEYYSSPTQEISLWCHGEFRSEHQPEPSQRQSRKQKTKYTNSASSSKRKASREETEEIMEKLKQKHGDKYKAGQYNAGQHGTGWHTS